MRKFAAISLLLVFAFNLFGYRLFVSLLVKKADQTLELALDNNRYNDNELISVKKAIHLPYYNNQKEFTRAYGEVEMNGILYQYVKSRIYNDTLEMMCIPNISKQELLKSKDNFTQVAFDLQKDAAKKSSANNKLASFVKVLSEYDQQNKWNADPGMTILQTTAIAYYTANSGQLHKATVEQPPDTKLI
ncbi:MAG: hypothetical protein JST86_10635 [Bacteroidetes bacterium]|nr:hypothetical protein [Bacteroidota bacterium]